MLAQYRGPRSRTSLEATSGAPEDDNAPPVLVLPSSTELFYFYAQTLDQCAQLFTGQPLYDLCSLFKKWLRIYAGMFYMDTSERATDAKADIRGGACGEHEEVKHLLGRNP